LESDVALTSMLLVNAEIDTTGVRREDFRGKEHLVVPVVGLVEGVLHPVNAPAPELALAEEFGRHPQGWNGRPTVLNHPRVGNTPVSANIPDVLEAESFGLLFNTELDGKKLKFEAWLDPDRMSELGDEHTRLQERLEDEDELVEVSTGLFMSLEQSSGTFNGEQFDGIWRNVVPDHLAFLSEGLTGACSVEGGCGAPRLNGAPLAGCAGCPSGPSSSCKCGRTMETDDQDQGEQQGLFQTLIQRVGRVLTFRSGSKGVSDRDVRAALDAALSVESPSDFHFVIAVFDSTFVFEKGFDGKLFERPFTISDDGTVALGSDVTQVRPVTEFVPVTLDQEEPAMSEQSTTEQVSALIENAGTRFNEDDREFLSGLTADQLAKFEPITENASAETETETETETAPDVTENASGVEKCQPKFPSEPKVVKIPTVESYLEAAPAPLRDTLRAALATHDARKDALVKGLVACGERCIFTEEQLRERSVEELESLTKLAAVPDYSVQGGASTLSDQSDDDVGYAPAPRVWPNDSTAA